MHQENKNVVQPGSRNPETRARNWLPLLVLAGLSGLLIFQAYAYYYRLPLSLGPRVILQPWLLQHGFIMYENIVDMHSPLMPMILAALVPLIPNGLRTRKTSPCDAHFYHNRTYIRDRMAQDWLARWLMGGRFFCNLVTHIYIW